MPNIDLADDSDKSTAQANVVTISSNLNTRPLKRHKRQLLPQVPPTAQRKKIRASLSKAFSVDAWPEALLHKNHSKLKNILSSVSLDTLNETFGYTAEQSALHAALQYEVTHPVIKRMLKQSPYLSPKTLQNETPYALPNLNCKVPFRPNSGALENEKIKCRHLAYACARGMLRSEHLKFDFKNNFTSADAIQKHVGFDTENGFHDLCATAPEIHMISNTQFGQWIADQFAQMEKESQDGQKSKVMLIVTLEHVMTLGLLIKEREGKRCYVVKFYDPNATGNLTRSEADDPEVFKTKTLGSYLLNASRLKIYLPYEQHDVVTLLRVTKAQIKASQTSVKAAPDARLLRTNGCKSGPVAAHAFLQYGLAEALKGLTQEFSNFQLGTKLEWLSAKISDGTPGLFMALQGGHADPVRVFADLLKQIPEDQRAELVAAKISDGTPGLFMALQSGCAEAVKAFAHLLYLIPEDQRAELVSAKTSEGMPGLFIALQNECAKAVEAFAHLLYLIPEDQRAQCVSAKTSDGMPGLFMALQGKHANVVIAFADLLKLVPENQRAELVSAKTSVGLPGFFMALQEDHAEEVEAFGYLLNLVPQDQRAELIAGKRSNGVPGLYMALQNGCANAVEAFADLLHLVPENECAALVNAKTNNGPSGLYMALANGHTKTIIAFRKLLHRVPSKQRAELLRVAIPGLKLSGPERAVQSGRAETVAAFDRLLEMIPKVDRDEVMRITAMELH